MKLSIGDVIVGRGIHNRDIAIEIVDVRPTGYTWKYRANGKYPGSESLFLSEDSSDPFF